MIRLLLPALLAACALLIGCGQKGPLVHPAEPAPTAESTAPATAEPVPSDASSTTNSDADSGR